LVLEGQSIGVTTPGTDTNGNAYLPRLYSVSSPRDGERPNFNNLSLTVKREPDGVCSNYLCDLAKGDEVAVTGPFGATFLLPDDPDARLLMICTGTGMVMFFGARSPETLPYFGPLGKLPADLIESHLVYSRCDHQEYVQDRMLQERKQVAELLDDEKNRWQRLVRITALNGSNYAIVCVLKVGITLRLIEYTFANV